MYRACVRFVCALKMMRTMQKAGAVSSTMGLGAGGSVEFHFAKRAEAQDFHEAVVRFGQAMKPGQIVGPLKALRNWLSQTGYEA